VADDQKIRVIDLQNQQEKESDKSFTEVEIENVTDDFFSVKGGLCLVVDQGWDIKPEIGDIARIFYGPAWSIRGLFINGNECFYRTLQEQIEMESGVGIRIKI